MSSNDGDFDVAGTLNEQDVKTSLIRDLCRRDVKFATPRKLLADARFPIVDQRTQFSLESDQVDVITQDLLTVDRVPTLSVITESMDALLKTKRKEEGNSRHLVVEYPSYGCFMFDSVRILSRYDILRTVAREVRQEEKWLKLAFKGCPQQQKT